MLVLARKTNQSIMIGHDIEIRLIDIKGEQVKLGITAPKHIAVHRKEVYEEIQSANIEARRNANKLISSLKDFDLKSHQKKTDK